MYKLRSLGFYRSLLARNLYRRAPALLEWKVKLRCFLRLPSRAHGLPSPLIISLTSYPPRFGTLPLTLKCLLTQSLAADLVVLWIAHQDKHALTPEIMALEKEGLKIEFCDDLRSFKKIIPVLQRYPGSFIVTADDDLYYRSKWLEELVNNYHGNPKEVICHRAHRIRVGIENLPKPYRQWDFEIDQNNESILNFPTTGAGALYPPNIFWEDVLLKRVFNRLCPDADDIWLYWMMRLNGGVARKVGPRRFLACWQGTQQFSLGEQNFVRSGNDVQISAMVSKYGIPWLKK